MGHKNGRKEVPEWWINETASVRSVPSATWTAEVHSVMPKLKWLLHLNVRIRRKVSTGNKDKRIVNFEIALCQGALQDSIFSCAGAPNKVFGVERTCAPVTFEHWSFVNGPACQIHHSPFSGKRHTREFERNTSCDTVNWLWSEGRNRNHTVNKETKMTAVFGLESVGVFFFFTEESGKFDSLCLGKTRIIHIDCYPLLPGKHRVRAVAINRIFDSFRWFEEIVGQCTSPGDLHCILCSCRINSGWKGVLFERLRKLSAVVTFNNVFVDEQGRIRSPPLSEVVSSARKSLSWVGD